LAAAGKIFQKTEIADFIYRFELNYYALDAYKKNQGKKEKRNMKIQLYRQ